MFAVILVLGLIMMSGCVQQDNTKIPGTNVSIPATTNNTPPANAPKAQYTIVMINYAFNPADTANIPLHKGTLVIWRNDDYVSHTVVSDTGEFSSPELAPGQSYTHLFETDGVYKYHCSIHPNMKGSITISG